MNKFQGMALRHFNPHPDKPTIVFLHDSLGSIELWRDLPQQIAEVTGCNFLVYDRLGYGKSDPMLTHIRPVDYMEVEADILNNLLHTFSIQDAILFGHSDGGTIALLTASKYPEHVQAVIVEAAHIFVEDVTLKGIYAAIDAYNKTNLPERLAKYHGDKVETLFKAWTETWTRDDYKDWNIEYFLPDIVAPLLFIQGEKDEYGSLDQVDKTMQLVSGEAKKLVIPNVGHTPHKEVPDVVFSATKEFINDVLK